MPANCVGDLPDRTPATADEVADFRRRLTVDRPFGANHRQRTQVGPQVAIANLRQVADHDIFPPLFAAMPFLIRRQESKGFAAFALKSFVERRRHVLVQPRLVTL